MTNQFIAASAALLLAGGCGGGAGSAEPVDAPPGLSVELHQFRLDQVERKILVGLRNDNSDPVYVREIQLVSDSFEPVPPTRIEQAFPRTTRVDLRIPYGAARCNATSIPDVRAAAVLARIRRGDRSTQRVRFRIPAGDPVLRQIVTSECGTYIAEQLIDARLGAKWTETATPRGKALRGSVVITRADDARRVALTHLVSNPHYTIRFVGVTLPFLVPARPGELELPVEITPARCDPHSFADAKTAHVYGVFAQVGDSGPYEVPFHATGRLRPTIDDFARRACGLS